MKELIVKTRASFLNITLTMILVIGFILIILPGTASAHCDTLDGPVAIEAIQALETGDITPILKWVMREHEGELKDTFNKTLAVRSTSKEVQEIADRYFLETLIRVHREGEGAPYTGLKPAGTIEPSVAAADEAIENGSVKAHAGKIGNATEKAIQDRFDKLMEAKKHKDDSVEAGREYVEAYVVYVHFVEGLHNTISGGGAHGSTSEAHVESVEQKCGGH